MDQGKFDILFLCHEKDKKILKRNLEYAKKNIIGYRKIFVLSEKNFFPRDKQITFINENIFPFDKKAIGEYAPKGRAGWYYQQFLKLYFLNVTGEEVLDNVLIVDADLMFIKKTKFFEGDIPLYNFETGYHQPYYDIMEKVFGFGKQKSNLSGTTHHMLYQRKYINEMLNLKARDGSRIFWKNIMKNIDLSTESGFSEQDMYFNYMLMKYPDKIKIRKIKFIDFPYTNIIWRNILSFLGYSYIASHEYFQHQKFPVIKSLTLAFLTRTGLKRPLKKLFIRTGLFRVK